MGLEAALAMENLHFWFDKEKFYHVWTVDLQKPF